MKTIADVIEERAVRMNQEEIAVNMLRGGVKFNDILRFTSLSLEHLERLRRGMTGA